MKIRISAKAEASFFHIKEFISTKWSENIAAEFEIKTLKILDLLSRHPQMFPLMDKKRNIRRCLITKQTSMYYRIDENEIFIITFFDNRQNPETMS